MGARACMNLEIVVLDANKEQCQGLCAMLDEQNFRATPLHSLKDLRKIIEENPYNVLILDLDTIQADKRLFRKLKRSKPSLFIMGLSSRPFHPELEEAMSSHIYACLSKPVDEEELLFWIKSLF